MKNTNLLYPKNRQRNIIIKNEKYLVDLQLISTFINFRKIENENLGYLYSCKSHYSMDMEQIILEFV